VLALDHATKTTAWLKEWDPERLDDVPSTAGYRDVLATIAQGPLLLGEDFQLTFINKNNSCHVDAFLEMLFTLAIWRESISSTVVHPAGGFRLRPALASSISACFAAQENTMQIPAPQANAAMTKARDAVLRALSPLTSTPIGEIGKCLTNLLTSVVWRGPEENLCTFSLVGKCPNGAAVVLPARSSTFRLEGGWNLHLPPPLLRAFCSSRPEGVSTSICPFEVVTSLFRGLISVRTITVACSCAACRGAKVSTECFVDVAKLDLDGSILPLPPLILLIECVDPEKSFNDYGFSPFSAPRPKKILSRLEGYLPFGPLGAHYTLIAVARHLGDTSAGGHWNCDVNLPRAGSWFHAENLSGQSTSITTFKDDRFCSGYLWVLDDK